MIVHINKVIHRDIKPENLLIDKNGTLKLADFGVSDIIEGEDDFVANNNTGTTPFLAPEQCQKTTKVKGKMTDIWSAGVTLYTLLFGKQPFTGNNILEIYAAITKKEPEIPLDTNPQLVDFLKGLLEKDPEKRLTIEQCKQHPWITENGSMPMTDIAPIHVNDITQEDINKAIVKGEELKTIDRFILMTRIKSKMFKKMSNIRSRLSEEYLHKKSSSIAGN